MKGALSAPRLAAQRGASQNLRRHFARSLSRLAVLLLSDLTTLWICRALLRGLREQLVSGGDHTIALGVLPALEHFAGWQFGAAFVLSLLVLGSYRAGDRRREPARLLAASALAVSVTLWHVAWQTGGSLAVLQGVVSALFLGTALVAQRLTLDAAVRALHLNRGSAARALFVGTPEELNPDIAHPVFTEPHGEYSSVGFIDAAEFVGTPSSSVLSRVSQVIAQRQAEVVVLCGPVPPQVAQAITDAALSAGCQLFSVPRESRLVGVAPALVWKRGRALVQLDAPRLRAPELIVKRLVDVAAAAAGMLVLAPIFVTIACLVKADSKGPVFFGQQRVGRGGRLFRILKFRTMVADAEDQRDELLADSLYADPRLFKIRNDPRLTRVGRWLRRFSLDELPQLLNVLRGEMSLVGPRPPLPTEVALYEQHHYARFDVKPGITGPWQVAGRNEITDFEVVIALETEYIRQWSLWRDIRILLQTVPVVLRGRGAL